MKTVKNQSGVSLIAAILALLIFSLFIAVAVSLVTTGSNIGLQEEQGAHVFYIADGGLQYVIRKNDFPEYEITTPVNLGSGRFTSSIPYLTDSINAGTTGPINVSIYSFTGNLKATEGFTQAPQGGYWIMLSAVDKTQPLNTSSTLEKISCTGKTDTSFSTCTRGRDSSNNSAHPQNAAVLSYTWDTSVSATLRKNVKPKDTTIDVDSTAGFLEKGFIRIVETNETLIEDVFYTGKTATSFTGCVRKAFNGGGNGFNHNQGRTVYQSYISVLVTVEGVMQTTLLAGNINRVVQGTIMPLQ